MEYEESVYHRNGGQVTLSGESTTFTASNGVTFDMKEGLCYACHDEGWCAYSPSRLGQAIKEFSGITGKKHCYTMERLNEEEN